ncbi:HupU protein [Granulosicoccaceae sp. 1_MG-2023]|nr:HupU protein [Granulosicoccaceae sp. 1_MG-2023]
MSGFNVLWLQSGGCGGCSMSLLNAQSPDLISLFEQSGINLLWHPSLSEQSADEVSTLLQAILDGDIALHALCLEGSVMRGPAGTGRFHIMAGTGKPMMHWLRELADVADYTLAIGSCAAFGGITAAGDNPGEACGLQFNGAVAGGLLDEHWLSRQGLPVINVAGCPTHPDWVTETLISLAMQEFDQTSLDNLNRPRFYTDNLVHHGCPRNEYYEYKASAVVPSDLGCMMENMGCLGTQAQADCNIRPWNGSGSCLKGGYACINCTAPGFEEPGHPFTETPKVAGIPVGLPTDMPKAWFVALASLAKAATPARLRENAIADHIVVPPESKDKRGQS